MKKLNQTGFGLPGIILIILILVAIGGAGWFVYDAQHNKKAAQQEAVVSETTGQDSGTAQNGYLGIPELGIELKLAEGVKDATYAVMKDGSSIGLSTEATVNEFGSGCSAKSGSVAMITSFVNPDAPDPYGGKYTMKETFPDAYKSADGVYYGISQDETFCGGDYDAPSDQKAADALIKQVRDGFNATKIQALKE